MGTFGAVSTCSSPKADGGIFPHVISVVPHSNLNTLCTGPGGAHHSPPRWTLTRHKHVLTLQGGLKARIIHHIPAWLS